MDFEESMREAARHAKLAVEDTVESYREAEVTDEDDITGFLAGALKARLKGQVGDLHWSSSVLRHRKGKAAEEKILGADLLIHVRVDTPQHKYSKGVLVQAKRVGPNEAMSTTEHGRLIKQCDLMLNYTPAAFVFNYTKSAIRAAPAIRIAGSTNRMLHSDCNMTSYGFFLQLFRCPIGDRNITSPQVKALLPAGADERRLPTIVEITGESG
ncbi:hypothetical protein ACCT28_36765 [Rhizobium ruizarguesonis]